MKTLTFPALSFLAATLSALSGCAGHPPPPPPEPPARDLYAPPEELQSLQRAESAPFSFSRRQASGGAAERDEATGGSLSKRMADPEPLPSAWPAPAPGAPLSPPGRKVAHEGSIVLRSPEPEALIDSADALAHALGGFSEARRKGWIRIRVPAASFDSAFSAVMGLGEVIAHTRQAEDITDAFQDAELRQHVVGTAIARLEVLLQRAKGDAQKLRLIEQLKAYREEWESLEARKRDLGKRADFAAITLEVRGRSVASDPGDAAEFPEFRWIRALTPFSDAGKGGRRLRFRPPAGFAATSRHGIWHATSPEGAEMSAWTHRPGLKGPPSGSARFWREAVRLRLAPQFKTSDSLEAGDFRFMRFVSHGPRVYEYWVGVAGKGSRVRVVEFYFPDTLQREKHAAALLASVKKGARAW